MTDPLQQPFATQYPLGHSINGSPHSVCVSLPTMADVIGYEEKDPAVLQAFRAGYPRFFRNPIIQELAVLWESQGLIQPGDPLLPTAAVATDLCHFLHIEPVAIPIRGMAWTIPLHRFPDKREDALAFLRHTGGGLSSREAEAILHTECGRTPFQEVRAEGDAASNTAKIRDHLHAIYGTQWHDDIHIFRSGMNAFYSGFRALQAIQLDRGKDLWIQLGWLYVDTSRILERFASASARPIQLLQVLDLHDLKEVLRENGRRVAGIVTETPTNPLVQTPDIQQLRNLADSVKAALILDPTLVSPHNVNILSFADLHINSLTKYAAAEADVMMGALALNAQSPFYSELEQSVSAFGTAPSPQDLARMAAQIGHYGEVIARINHNTIRVAEHLESHPAVHSVHWAYAEPAGYNFRWLQHLDCGPGGIISFSLKGDLAAFYDRSRIVKSPSFGARFTLMCPFMYLAHYDLVSTPAGQALLRANGIDPRLIRLSVGTEPAEAIIAELDRCL